MPGIRTRRSSSFAERTTGLVVLAMCTAIAVVAGSGCQRVLFPDNAPRTQFESHDRLRHRSAPLTEFDEFGREQPALRSRLSPARS
jgi:hypothetical protein